jgi:alpha/beta superfamily hydrolase
MYVENQVRPRSITFSSADCDTIRLEGTYHYQVGDGQWPAAVVCHPHPLGGGTMHNKVVVAIARELVNSGVLALRFNFRGVEGSAGEHDNGRGEQADVAGALDWLFSQPGVDPWRVSLVGYSFGAWVGLSQAQRDSRLAAVALVGLPAQHCNPSQLQAYTRPKLFVSGEADQIAPPATLRKLVDRLPGPKRLEIVAGVDHLWRGHEHEVGELVAGFVSGL